MSEGDTDDDKQYEATQKKLDDARRKGEVPKSADLITAGAYAGLLVAALGAGHWSLDRLGADLRTLLAQADDLAALSFGGSPSPLMGGVIWRTALAVAPWLVIPATLALLSVIAQRAFVVAPSRAAPKLNRISPVAGAKNKFGRNGLFEFAKSTAKLVIFSLILGAFLYAQRNRMIGALFHAPQGVLTDLGALLTALLVIVLGVALSIGGVDFLWQRAEHLRKHRMSRKELMDELKQSEGDPMMKNQRRQRSIDLANNRMMNDVPTADVVVVNPTHYAVALKWDAAPGRAPVCVAKGCDEVAARIRALALEHGVPIHSDPPAARALHATVEIGAEIAPEHYEAVATAIRFAQAMRARARKRS